MMKTIYDQAGQAHQIESVDCRDLLAQGWSMSPPEPVAEPLPEPLPELAPTPKAKR